MTLGVRSGSESWLLVQCNEALAKSFYFFKAQFLQRKYKFLSTRFIDQDYAVTSLVPGTCQVINGETFLFLLLDNHVG